jgi:hypothetical protein
VKGWVTRGKGFRGALNYVLDTNQKAPEIVGGNMSGTNPSELMREFGAAKQLRPDITRPVWHCSLSLPAGERLESERWREVAADCMSRMGFSESTPYLAARHKDTDHDHIHIIASRVDLEGKVWLGKWEARSLIEVSQQLEKDYNLTLTKGLEPNGIKQLSKNEIEQALRTNQEPARQKLQRLVDESLKDHPTAGEFAERLTLAGVEVRANLASTGRMNGFSYEVDGIAFKSSHLGKDYTWKKLQERGLQYEQEQHSKELERFRATAPVNRDSNELAADLERPTSRAEDHPEVRDRINQDLSHSPADRSLTEAKLRRSDQGINRANSNLDTRRAEEARDQQQRDQESKRELSSKHELTRNLDREITPEGKQLGRSSEQAQEVNSKLSPENNHDLHNSLSNVNSSNKDQSGLEREREQPDQHQASRDNQRATTEGQSLGLSLSEPEKPRFHDESNVQSQSARHIEKSTIADTRQIDPTGYLRSQGFNVERQGRHLSVTLNKDEVYRITQKPEGHWVACDKYGNGIGDNLALVREIEPRTGFAEAVYKLRAEDRPELRSPVITPKEREIHLPSHEVMDKVEGRLYLERERGISKETIDHAEKSGFLTYSKGAVIFTGRDRDGEIRNATRRAIRERDEVQKRDFRGSDKSFPPILSGRERAVWIVEGGTDALAARDLAIRQGKEPPTFLVSGGAHTKSYLDNPEVQRMLERADKIVLVRENEKSLETQAKTDKAYDQKVELLKERYPDKQIEHVKTPRHAKDLAELNLQQVREIRQKALELERGRGLER